MFKNIRRLVSSFLTATLLVSTIPTAGFAADEGTERKVLTTDNFQTYSVGSSTVGSYGGAAKGNIWKLEEEDGNKYFAMTINTTSDAHLDGSFGETVEDKMVFQFDMRFRDYGPVTKWLYFMDNGGKDIFILDINPNGTITTHNGVAIGSYALNKWYTVAVELDCKAGIMNVKFNNKWRLLDHPVGACAPAKWRFHMRSPSGDSTVDLDNLMVYTGGYTMDNISQSGSSSSTSGASASTADPYAFKYDLNAMYIGKDSTLVKGQQVYISQNDEIVPYKNGDVKMVPVKAFTESLGGTASWDPTDSSATFTAKGKTVKLFSGKRTCVVDGAEKTLMCPSDVGAGNVFYAPAKDLCEFFGQYLHEEDNGLIIYSDIDHSADLNWNTNMKGMRNLCESFMFDDVTGAELSAMLEARHPNQHHPRLIFTEEKFAKIRAEINDPNGDPIYKKMFEELKRHCETYMTQTPSGYEIRDGIRLLYVVRENANRMLSLAILYNLTGEEKYARRAYEEMYVSSCFVDFNPYHFLDVGEMASCLGLSYDWLYNWMDAQQRKVIRDAIIKKGIYPIIEDFDGKPRSRSWNWRGELADNWCLVISGVAVGAMAVVDEATGLDRTNCERAMEQCLIDIRRALSLFAPYGAYEEGFNYWDYAMRYYVQTMECLDTAIGDDFGYEDVVGMSMTHEFLYAMNGSVQAFSYHDTGEAGVTWHSPIMWLAKTFNRPEIAQPRVEQIQRASSGTTNIVWDMYLYDPSFLDAQDGDKDLDVCLPIAEIATMRSGYDQSDMWLGLHCDNPMGDGGGHDHMDSGQFVLDSQGVNWFFDLGADNYNIGNYSHAYRVRGEGHNVLIFNPTADYSFKPGGKAQIDKFETAPKGAFAVGNLDEAYQNSTGVISHRRGAKLDDMRRVATIQDEVRLAKPAEMYWFAHTRAEIEISEDGKTAILTQHGKKLMARIVNGEGAKFSVMDAVPFPQSPQNPNQNKNVGVRKLTIHLPEVQNIDLTVCFVDYDATYYEEGMYKMEYKPIDEWEIEAGALPDTSVARATGIYLDGNLIQGFDPYKDVYAVGGDEIGNYVNRVTATGDGEIIIRQSKDSEGVITIVVKGKEYQRPKVYTLKFNLGGGIGEPAGKAVITPKAITVSDIPQPQHSPENLADGDLTTKWAAEGVHWLQYDLGSVRDLDSMSIAFMEGDTRTAQFEIWTSEDGKTYKQWFDGDSMPTLELENHRLPGAKARYVKVVVKGYNNNPGNWNSVMEVRVYAA